MTYPRGTYSRIARQLGVTPQHVRNVALGKTDSRRVTKALDRAARLFAESEARRTKTPTPPSR